MRGAIRPHLPARELLTAEAGGPPASTALTSLKSVLFGPHLEAEAVDLYERASGAAFARVALLAVRMSLPQRFGEDFALKRRTQRRLAAALPGRRSARRAGTLTLTLAAWSSAAGAGAAAAQAGNGRP